MIKVESKKFIFVYKKTDINTFVFNNELYSIFDKYLKDADMQVFPRSLNDDNMPLCIWTNPKFVIAYFKTRLEIQIISDVNKFDQSLINKLIEKLCEFTSLKRIGILTSLIIDEEVLQKFSAKNNLSINNFKKDFEISWLENFNNGQLDYNFWKHLEKNKELVRLTFDINNDLVDELKNPNEVLNLINNKEEEAYNAISCDK